MYHQVVDECIDHAIRSDADADRYEDRQLRSVEAKGERADHGTGKDDRIEVIELDSTWFNSSSVQVMAAVEAQAKAVHDPPVQRIRDGLHQYEGNDCNKSEAHGAYGSRCRAEY